MVNQSGSGDSINHLPLVFQDYCCQGHETVKGWVEPGVLTLVSLVCAAQEVMQVAGPVAEIGIHQGRFFIALMLAKKNCQGVAVDVFEEQHLNPDGSGRGDYDVFTANLDRFGIASSDVAILKSDSKILKGSDITAPFAAGISIFSVDGAHAVEYTISDLNLAAAALNANGVIILDDYFNLRWPGVSEGLFRWLETTSGRDFSIFMYGNNKAFLARHDAATVYTKLIADSNHRYLRKCIETRIAGHPSLFAIGVEPSTAFLARDDHERSIAFGRGYSGYLCLRSGWSQVEADGVWAVESLVQLEVPVHGLSNSNVQLTIEISTWVPADEMQHLIVTRNGTNIAERRIGKSESVKLTSTLIELPSASSSIMLSIHADKLFNPCALGVSKDNRNLAFKLKKLIIERATRN